MESISTIVGTVVGAAGLLGLAGSVVNGKRKDGAIAIYKSSNDELRKVVDDKDKRIKELELEVKSAELARDTAETLRQAAVDMAQSRPQFDILGSQMVKQHKELLSAIGRQTEALSELAQTIAQGQTK